MTYILRIFDGESGSVRVQEVSTSSVKIGRHEDCDVVLPSPYLSRNHALIREDQGRYYLEVMGRNPMTVRDEEVPAGQRVTVEPDEEIRVAQYSLFIEAQKATETAAVNVSQLLGEIQLRIHSDLLERIDLTETDSAASREEGTVDHRLLQILDELVKARISTESDTALPPDVFRHALYESLYGEVVQEVLRRSGGAERAERISGFMGRLDKVLEQVIETLCGRIGVQGGQDNVRTDLHAVDVGFPGAFEDFTKESTPALKVLLVQRYLMREILNLVCGFGPLQDLLELPNTSEIMVVHKDLIYIERDGSLERLQRSFITDEILISIIQRIVDPLGRRVDRSTPLVDARLPDGSRVNAIIPPLAVRGPCLTIRKFSKDPLTVADLVRFGSLTPIAAKFLQACVASHKNMVISGGTGSGKTTLLNILSSFISDGERIVTIEDSAEVQLRQPHVVTLETRPPNVEGKGAYTIRDLVRNALRMRPDRIVVGECRGGEALDMLQAMNTGHDGSLTTLHANTPTDALLRLETLVLEAVDLPIRAIRDQIEAAVHMIVQTLRLPSGKRMVTHISEIVGVDPEYGNVITNDIFEEVDGTLMPTGYLPRFIDELVSQGHLDPRELFAREDLMATQGVNA